MSKSKMIVRTKFVDRACHWTVVICFFLVAVSGISFFFPTLQWLTETFGTPQMGRILHPFFGVLIFVVLMLCSCASSITIFRTSRISPG